MTQPNHLKLICKQFGIDHKILARITGIETMRCTRILRDDEEIVSTYTRALKAFGAKVRIELDPGFVLRIPSDHLRWLYFSRGWRAKHKLIELPKTNGDLCHMINDLARRYNSKAKACVVLESNIIPGGRDRWTPWAMDYWLMKFSPDSNDPIRDKYHAIRVPRYVITLEIGNRLPSPKLPEWLDFEETDTHVLVNVKPLPGPLHQYIIRRLDGLRAERVNIKSAAPGPKMGEASVDSGAAGS